MISSFLGLEMGKGALKTSQQGLQTVGHNLNNLNTEGYSRQRVTQKTMPALFPNGITKPNIPGQLGTGVTVEELTRVRDILLDDRIIYENGGLGFWKQKKTMLNQLEMLMNEPSTSNVRTDLEAFWHSWQSVSESPTDDALRIHLLERTKTLNETFRAQHQALKDMQKQTNSLVEQQINRLNNIADIVSTLNVQIKKQELTGDQPNDLYDKRDLLIDELSQLADIRVERGNKNEFIVYIGAEKLVQGEYAAKVEAYEDPNNLGFISARWQQTGQNVNLGMGEISGLVEVRDQDLGDMLNRINYLSYSVSDSVNAVHKEGFGLSAQTGKLFFRELSLSKNENGSFDFNQDGVLDSTALFRITGTEKLDPEAPIAAAGVINLGSTTLNGADITVQYREEDTPVQIIEKINQSGAGVTAYLDFRGRFSIKAQASSRNDVPNFALRHLEDSGSFLTGIAGVLQESGADGAFDWQSVDAVNALRTTNDLISLSPEHNIAGLMQVSQDIDNKPEMIAAAQGYDYNGDGTFDIATGLNDNRNALALANLRFTNVMTVGSESFADFFQGTVAKAGTVSEKAILSYDKTQTVAKSLTGIREKISGVNVDEEMTKMLALQHAYNAAARLISTSDRLLDVIINRMGV
ncbi:MAG: flagellar hook-associated protein FlgK [Brevinemataceae bacterium]